MEKSNNIFVGELGLVLVSNVMTRQVKGLQDIRNTNNFKKSAIAERLLKNLKADEQIMFVI